MPEQYEFPQGHHMVKLFPVEGDSAIAELWFGEAPSAQLSLTGIDVAAAGDERLGEVGFNVSLFPPPGGAEPGWWEFDLDEVQDRLADAKQWLVDNERGRLSLDDEGGLTAAGRAMYKATGGLEP